MKKRNDNDMEKAKWEKPMTVLFGEEEIYWRVLWYRREVVLILYDDDIIPVLREWPMKREILWLIIIMCSNVRICSSVSES